MLWIAIVVRVGRNVSLCVMSLVRVRNDWDVSFEVDKLLIDVTV